MTTGSIQRRVLQGWRPYLLIAALVFCVYASSFSFGFTFLDDNEFIIDNHGFISDLSNVGRIFGQTIFANPNIPYYRPIFALTLMLDAQVGGAAPFIYHATNVLLHCAVTCLVFLLLTRLTGLRLASFFLALLFGVHPVLTQAVAWIPGRNDLLLGFFCLLSFLALLRYVENGSLASYLSSMVFFGLALFTKESALILFGLLVFYLWLERGSVRLGKREPLVLGGWLAMAAFWFLVRAAALFYTCDRSSFDGISLAVMKSMPAFAQYLGKIFLPCNLSVYPTMADTGYLYALLSAGALAALIAAPRGRNWRLIVFGSVWFTFFLVSSFIRPSPECVLDFQEHRMYLPMMGCVIVLSGTALARRIETGGRPILWLCALTIVMCSLLTVRHEYDYRDRWAFWDNATRTSRNSAYIHLRAGYVYYISGALEKAEAAFRKALELDPELASAHIKLGLVMMDKKQYDDAAAAFREEIRISPGFDMAYMALGVVRYRQGRYDEAERLWKRALRVNKYGLEARKNLMLFYHERGDKARSSFYARELEGLGMPVPPQYLERGT